jgi:hypothetical protein
MQKIGYSKNRKRCSACYFVKRLYFSPLIVLSFALPKKEKVFASSLYDLGAFNSCVPELEE